MNTSLNREPIIDYEDLVVAYHQSLTTMLRGFRSMEEFDFLEIWVPDDDPARSILNLIEAAKERNLKCLTVILGSKTLKAIDLDRWKEEIRSLALVAIERTTERAELRIQLEDTIHPVYQKGLEPLLKVQDHEGILREEKGLLLAEARDQETVLAALVDPETRIVRKAAYQNAVSVTQRGLLEGLCGLLEGRPLQEVSDHTVQRLEETLRDKKQPPPVAGVVAVSNADPAFQPPLRLSRGLMNDYRKKTQWGETKNSYDEPVSPSWGKTSQEERVNRLVRKIGEHPSGRFLQLVRLEGTQRVVVAFEEPLENPVQRQHLLDLEAYLRVDVEPTLQVYLQPKFDENKPRQAKGVHL